MFILFHFIPITLCSFRWCLPMFFFYPSLLLIVPWAFLRQRTSRLRFRFLTTRMVKIIMEFNGISDLIAYFLIDDVVLNTSSPVVVVASHFKGMDCFLGFYSQSPNLISVYVAVTRESISYIFQGSQMLLSFHITLSLLVQLSEIFCTESLIWCVMICDGSQILFF